MLLSDFNYGLGVDVVDGIDFLICWNDGFIIDIDISSVSDVGDVIGFINGYV